MKSKVKTNILNKQENFPRTKKKVVSKFNEYELRGWVIDRMSRIEEDIDNIIYEYFKPKEKHLFRKLMLNTSIITTSAKIKIISNFPNIDHVIINKFQRVLSIRNCFAHLPIQRVLQINFSRDSRSVNEVKSIQNIEYMNSSGKLITKSLTKLIDEFFELEKGIKEDILKFKL